MRQRQKLYERMMAHLREQGQCVGSAGTCRYRGPNGLKCAVGALLKDEYYRAEFEGITPSGTTPTAGKLRAALVASGVVEEKGIWEFLRAAQRELHDEITQNWAETLECRAKNFCMEHLLAYTPPSER